VKTETKRVLIIIVAIVGVIAAGLLIYAALVSPSKQPYRDALAKFKVVYNANVTFTNSGSSLGTTTATDEQFSANIKKSEAALETLKTETAALAKQPVLTEGEGKARYDAFATQLKAYAAYNTSILDSIEMVRPVIFECSRTTASIRNDEATAQAFRACAAKLGGLTTVPDTDYQTLVVSFKASYEALAENLGDEDEQTRILGDLTTANTTLSKNLQKHRAEVDITATAKALNDYLDKKASIF